MASALGIPVRVFGEPCGEATLVIANHISWFDIIAFGNIVPARFLAKIEVKHMPVIGWLATRAGTLYIERGGKTAASNTIKLMAETLTQQNVVLFAEGTTKEGSHIKFHSRLMQSAIDADCKIQPVAVRYPSSEGNGTHPAALFTDNISMRQSFFNILTVSSLVAELHFLEPVAANGMSRDELAAYAEEKVRSVIENEQAAS
jgi:1-acyl-sn-glycerol-3-phosphate acyltransferase